MLLFNRIRYQMCYELLKTWLTSFNCPRIQVIPSTDDSIREEVEVFTQVQVTRFLQCYMMSSCSVLHERERATEWYFI